MDSSGSLERHIYNETQENEHSRLRTALSVLLCVLSIILMCSFIILMVIRSIGVGHIIRSINVVEIIEETNIGLHPSYIVDQINELYFVDVEVSLYDIEEFIRREAVANELDNIVNAYAMAFMFGNHDYYITVDEIVDIARRLEPELYESFGYRLAEEDLGLLTITLDDMIDFDVLSIEGIMEELNVDLTVPLVLISPVLIWVVGIVTTALLVFIFLLKRKTPISASLAVGIPITLAGLLTLITGLVIGFNPTILGDTSLQFVRLVERPIHLMTRYGLIFTAVGATILIVTYILKRVTQRTESR